MAKDKKRIQSRLFGPHTKAMNASEYEVLTALINHNTVVVPLFNTYATGDIAVSLESVTTDNSARVDESFQGGFIIPFDLVNLHLPKKGYAALRHIARPDLFYLKDNLLIPIDVKNAVRSMDNLRQISSDNMAHIFEHNEYFGMAIAKIINGGASLDDLVFDDGFSLSMIASKRKDNSLMNILEGYTGTSELDFPCCSSKDATTLLDVFLDEDLSYTGKVSALEMQKSVGDIQTAIHHLGAAPYSLIVVDAFDSQSRPAFRFSYLRDQSRPLSIFPTDIVLAESVRDEYVNTFYSNPQEIDKQLEKLFLPARLQHKISSLEDSIERDEHRIESINEMIALDYYNRDYDRTLAEYEDENSKINQKELADSCVKIKELTKEVEKNKKKLSSLNIKYEKSLYLYEAKKEAFAKHSKLGWEKYFGPLFKDSMERFDDEIKKRKDKFATRETRIEKLNEKFADYNDGRPFFIDRSPKLAKLYFSLDKGRTYHTFSLSEKRLLHSSNSK